MRVFKYKKDNYKFLGHFDPNHMLTSKDELYHWSLLPREGNNMPSNYTMEVRKRTELRQI